MASRIKLLILVLLLTLIGGGLAAYKHVRLGIPMIVGDKPTEWLVEAKVTFIANGEPVTVRLSLPTVAVDREKGIGADARSAEYSFFVDPDPGQPAAVWSSDSLENNQALYYRVRFPARGVDSAGSVGERGEIPVPTDPGLSGTLRAAADSVVRRAREFSSNPETLLVGVFREIAAIEGSQEISLLKQHYEEVSNGDALTLLGIDLLNMAGVPARQAYAVGLNEVRGAQEPQLFVEYHDGVYWKVRNPASPASTLDPREWFVWNRGGDPLLEVSGGENSQVRFTTTRDVNRT